MKKKKEAQKEEKARRGKMMSLVVRIARRPWKKEEKEQDKALLEEKEKDKASLAPPSNTSRKRGRAPFDPALATPGCAACSRRVLGLSGGSAHACHLARRCK